MSSNPISFKLNHDIPVYIGIEYELYIKNQTIFDSILRSFSRESLFHKDCLYLFSNRACFDNCKDVFYCKLEGGWIYQCIAMIEDYVTQKLQISAFHAAAVLYKGNTLVFLGERFSGKSTLTNYMINQHNCTLLDDDMVFYDRKNFIGLGIPLRMRSKPLHNSNVLCEFLDEKNTIRYLTSIGSHSMYSTNPVYAFFLNFNNDEDMIERLKGAALFESLLKSIRYSKNNMVAFGDVCNIMRYLPAFELKYRDSKTACSLIDKILYPEISCEN